MRSSRGAHFILRAPKGGAVPLAVLRLGHRPGRDKRTTTHLLLTARALGAHRCYLTAPDPEVQQTLVALQHRWGPTLEVIVQRNWRKVLKERRGGAVHLTMYGQNLPDVLPALEALRQRTGGEELLVVVGGAKVPGDVYQLVDFNVAVGNQPHSEVAALAILLEHLGGAAALRADFGGPLRVVPQARGKVVDDSSQR